jgi:predicted GNAT family acetyltransferase
MVDIDKQSLADIFDVGTDSISVDVDDQPHGIEEEPLEELYKANILSTDSGLKFTAEVSVSSEIVCEIDYMVFGDIGYIHWTSVPEKYWNQGVATIVREGVVEDIKSRGVSSIYSYPASQTGLLLAKKQEFDKTDDLSHGLGTWLKLSV